MAPRRVSGFRSAVLVAALLLAIAGSDAGERGRAARASLLRVTEGVVVSVAEAAAEGDLRAVMVRVEEEEGGGTDLVLAPAPVLEQAGFHVEEGDRLRARFFATESSKPARVQKVLNLSRGLMVRLRTLHRHPLWDGSGNWQGAPGGHRGGRRHGHGSGRGSKQGPGPGGR